MDHDPNSDRLHDAQPDDSPDFVCDWEQLPENPRGFFRLTGTYDRRDLKRAYGKLIRMYKPETYPSEFQKIRIAYEQLENRLRYGESRIPETLDLSSFIQRDGSTLRNQDLQETPHQMGDGRVDSSVPYNASISTSHSALASPAETYAALVAKKDRTSHEYYVVALLSDLIPSNTKSADFFHWLLMGIQDHDSDPGIGSLLAEFLRSEVCSEDMVDFLQLVAETVQSPLFYRLTEKLWERMISEKDFVSVEGILETCEKFLKQKDFHSRNVFYLNILPAIMWKAPYQWVERQIQLLERDYDSLDRSMQFDLEIVSLLFEYVKSNPEPRIDLSARSTIHKLIIAFSSQRTEEATSIILTSFNELGRDSHGLRKAFPFEDNWKDSYLLMLLSMIAGEYSNDLLLHTPAFDNETHDAFAKSLLKDIQPSIQLLSEKTSLISTKFRWIPFVFLIFPWSLVTGFLSILPMIFDDSFVGATLTLIASFNGGFMFWYFRYLYPKKIEPLADKNIRDACRKFYEQHWRERIFRYIQSSNEPLESMLDRLEKNLSKDIHASWLHLIREYCLNDIGLMIFAQARPFCLLDQSLESAIDD